MKTNSENTDDNSLVNAIAIKDDIYQLSFTAMVFTSETATLKLLPMWKMKQLGLQRSNVMNVSKRYIMAGKKADPDRTSPRRSLTCVCIGLLDLVVLPQCL